MSEATPGRMGGETVVSQPGGPAGLPSAGRSRRSDVLALVVGAVVVIGAWQLVVAFAGYQPFLLPGPLDVGIRFVGAWADGTMTPHALTTLQEVLLGFVVGAGLGVPVGVLLARSRFAARLLSPYIVAAQAMPILALAPLIALWFGTGLLSKVVICGLIVFFPVAVSTMVGVRSVDPRLIEMARAFRASRNQLIREVELPAALPAILGGMRVGATLAVVGAIVGEWAGADQGLGVLVNLARGSLFDTPLMFATLLTIALLGVALYLVVVLVERRVVGARG
ncbi:MAG TPA: ABC transporter permease [Candidatus Saccharimonadia bacterium]|nr:ABC transporter permease [Candidatus Saccharimonadia bacterium]